MSASPGRKKLLLVLAMLLPLVSGTIAWSDGRDDDDHDLAREALENNRARPLVEILAEVEKQIDGEVVGLEFEREHGRYVYELKVVTPQGRLLEVYVDAMTAEILSSEYD